MDPRAAARAMVAVVLVAVAVSWATSMLQPPRYEAEALVLVGERAPEQGPRDGTIQLIPNAPMPETLQMPTQTMARAIESRPVAREVIRRSGLRMDPDELLDNLTVEAMEGTQFVRLAYESTNPYKAKRIVNAVGKETPEFSPESGSNLTATVWQKAELPETPVSPHPLRNGLLALVIGLVLCAGIVAVRPGVQARAASTLGERPSRQRPATWYSDHSIIERNHEKKLLRAIGRRGKLTAIQAALDTSLSVAESRRILEELAFAGHLEITFEDDKLYYAFWERD